MVKNQFLGYLQQFIAIEEDDFVQFYAALEFKQIAKGDLLLRSDKICRHQFFILKGLLVVYEPDDKGKDHIIQIAVENNWTGDLASYTHELPSKRYILALEDCELLLLSKQKEEILLKKIPILEKLFRILFQRAYINQTERVSMMLQSDATQRFEIFREKFPFILQRIEWKIIASYLDMTPETLSRIKSKMA
jgi:CRP-like cAMP-binding protein